MTELPTTLPPWASDGSPEDYGAIKDFHDRDNVAVIDPTTQTSAAMFLAQARDTAIAINMAPFARVKFQFDDSTPADPTILAYKGQHAVGTSFAPTITRIDDGYVQVEFDPTYQDFYGQTSALQITMASATLYGANPGFATCEIIDSNKVSVYAWNPDGYEPNALVQLTVDVRGDN